MKVCAVCGVNKTQKCHVKDKHTFKGEMHHDFHNIIYLCAYHHYEFFDQSRLAIDPETNELILLRCILNRRIEIIQSKNLMAIQLEYINWKNIRAHTYLKAELRKKRLSKL